LAILAQTEGLAIGFNPRDRVVIAPEND